MLLRNILSTQKRFATYTVDVYLLKDVGQKYKAGQIITIKPGYARHVLVPQRLGILMGEGEFRKVIPQPEKFLREAQKHVRITARDIEEQIAKLLSAEPQSIFSYLESIKTEPLNIVEPTGKKLIAQATDSNDANNDDGKQPVLEANTN